MASPQSLEAERDQYLKDFGSNKFSFVCEIIEMGVERNTQYNYKIDLSINGRVLIWFSFRDGQVNKTWTCVTGLLEVLAIRRGKC